MRLLHVVLATCLISTVAAAAELSWPELVRRPEFWPAHCTIKRAVQLQSGQGVKAGQTVDVLEMHANEIVLGTPDGHTSFGAKPDDTDVVAVANAAMGKLTPAQRELTYTSLLQRQELWPYRVALTAPFDLSGGRRAERGDKVILVRGEGRKLLVFSERLKTSFDVAPQETDFMAQARQFVEDKQAAPGRVIGELEGKLISSATGQPAPLDASALPRYIVFFHGRKTCGYTRQFTPTLVNFYKEMKPKHPEFEVIYVRDDATVADMENFAKEKGFSWRAVTVKDLPVFNRAFDGPLPHVLVMDRSGKVLADGAGAIAAPAALKQLRALLEKASARN